MNKDTTSHGSFTDFAELALTEQYAKQCQAVQASDAGRTKQPSTVDRQSSRTVLEKYRIGGGRP